MTSASFNRPGAVDLSALKNQAPTADSAAGGAGGSYVQEIGDIREFEGVLRKSMQYPLVVEFHSPRAQGAEQLSRDLSDLAAQAAGKWLLVRVDVDTHGDIAQAMGVQGVPTVVAVVGGQLAPLFRGVQPKEALVGVLEQVLQAAVANGIVGTAEPVGGGAAAADQEGEQQAPADPRFAEADAALERGDFAAAEAEFDKILAQTPNDAEALAGKAQAGLLARSSGMDGSETVRADAAPDDIDAQLTAADAELLGGNVESAFNRLVETVRRTSGDDRDRVRKRLLELFETVGASDPLVLKYRRKLATALF